MQHWFVRTSQAVNQPINQPTTIPYQNQSKAKQQIFKIDFENVKIFTHHDQNRFDCIINDNNDNDNNSDNDNNNNNSNNKKHKINYNKLKETREKNEF